MTIEFAVKGLVAIAFVILLYWVINRFQTPREGTEHLAMTVWAAFGPYESAELSEKGLRRACRAVFGREGSFEHEKWILGHVENFHSWEAEGCFGKGHEMMRKGLKLTAYGPAFDSACQRYRDEVISDASGIIASVNEDLGKSGHRMEATKQPDGTYQLRLKQIWSNEQIERTDREMGEQLLSAIGNNLLEDPSPAAKQLQTFLGSVYETSVGVPIKTAKEIGIAWLACLETKDKDPNSEVATIFRILNTAWETTKCQIKAKRLELNLSKEDFAKTAVHQTAENLKRVFGTEDACSGFTGARVIYKRGEQAIAEFSDHMVEMVKQIVNSETPLLAMRKALIDSLECYILDSTLWVEEFSSRRDALFLELNARGTQLTAEGAAVGAIWADAESLFLRLIQESMFEEVSKEDWWTKYSALYGEHVRSVYRAALAKADGNCHPLHALLVKTTKDTTDEFKKRLFELQ